MKSLMELLPGIVHRGSLSGRSRLVYAGTGPLFSAPGVEDSATATDGASAGLLPLVQQCRAAREQGLYQVALFATLTLPDICSGLGSESGATTGTGYRAWLVSQVGYDADLAALIYGLRCSLLHQGRAHPHRQDVPVAMLEPVPPAGTLHLLETEALSDGTVIFWLSVDEFVNDITDGVLAWLEQFGATGTVMRNLAKFARRRPEGLPPHVLGRAVIA